MWLTVVQRCVRASAHRYSLAVATAGAMVVGGCTGTQSGAVQPGPSSASRGPGLAAPRTGPPVTSAARVRVVAAGAGAYDVRYGLGAVWVATIRGVTELDPSSGRVVGRVDLENHSEWSNVAVGDGAVWFLGAKPSGPVIVRLDPTTLRADPPIALPNRSGGAYEGIAVTGGVACVGRLQAQPGTVCLSEHGGPSWFLPARGPPEGVAGFAPHAAAGGALWIGGASLTRLDPVTRNTTTIGLPPRGRATALAADRGALWAAIDVYRRPSQLWRITAGRVDRRITLQARGVSALAATAGGVWVVTGGTSIRVSTVRPDGALVAVATVAADDHALTASPTALWATHYRSGTVLRLTRSS